MSLKKIVNWWIAPLIAFLFTSGAWADKAAKPQIWLVLGDSLSAAYNLPTEQGWVALLQKSWSVSAPQVTVINASVSGATTAAGLQRLPGLLRSHQPDWVFLELGGNDGLQGKPIEHIRANLRQIVQLSKATGAQVVLAGMRLPPNLGKRYTEPFFHLYGEIAEEYQLPFVPFLLEGVAGDPHLMLADGLHPNAIGQQRIFAGLTDFLNELVQVPAKMPVDIK